MATGFDDSWSSAADTCSLPLISLDPTSTDWAERYLYQSAYCPPATGYLASGYVLDHHHQPPAAPSYAGQNHIVHESLWPSGSHCSKAHQLFNDMGHSINSLHSPVCNSIFPLADPLLHPGSTFVQSYLASPVPALTLNDSPESAEASLERQLRRKIQNRVAQRAFRERRDSQIRATESQLAVLKKQLAESRRANQELKTSETKLKKQVKELQEVLDAFHLIESHDILHDKDLSSQSEIEADPVFWNRLADIGPTSHSSQNKGSNPSRHSCYGAG